MSGQGPDLVRRSRAAGWLTIVGDLQPVSVLARSGTRNRISNQSLYRLYVSPRCVGHAESHDDDPADGITTRYCPWLPRAINESPGIPTRNAASIADPVPRLV